MLGMFSPVVLDPQRNYSLSSNDLLEDCSLQPTQPKEYPMEGNTILRIFLILAGLFSIAGAAMNWEFFMNNRRARPFVSVLGPNGARIFYVGLGLVIIAIAVFAL
jgi:hypothetical protein